MGTLLAALLGAWIWMILASFLITFWDPLPERFPTVILRFPIGGIGIGNRFPKAGRFVALPVTPLMIGPDHHFLAQVRKRTPILRLGEKMQRRVFFIPEKSATEAQSGLNSAF